MSDYIEQNGKKYYEESYLLLANHNAERRGQERDAALARIDALEREKSDNKRYLDAVAQALHPHKPTEDWTYLPDQLAGMIEALKGELDEAERACDKHINHWHAALDQRDEARAQVVDLRKALEGFVCGGCGDDHRSTSPCANCGHPEFVTIDWFCANTPCPPKALNT